MRRFTLCALLSLICLASPAVLADARSNQQLSELISRSRLLCASALLYFDPLQRNLDPRGLTAVYYHLNSLDTLVVQLGQPAALLAPLTALKATFTRLDRLPPAERQRYPELLDQLLGQQRQLQEAAAAAAGPGGHLLQLQSRDLAQLLLDYQLRHYHWPQPRADLLAQAQREQLDQAIGQRFSQLEQAQPEQFAALKAIRGHYLFVRKQLHGTSQGAGGGVEFYLSRAVLDLDELAASQL